MTPKELHPDDTRPTLDDTRPSPKESSAFPQHSTNLPTRERSAYEVEGELARGGLGRILRAKDTHLGRVVALKETLRGGNHIKERFLREALLTAKLQHPSIVPIYEAGVWPTGEPFYSMKLISGEPLLESVQRRSSLEARLSLLPNLLAACEAMAYAHSQRVIHRDLKPQNILLGEFGETVVIDWGLAKELSPQQEHSSITARAAEAPRDSELTQAGSIIGTPAYMPPEQARGLVVDERADVYSLGAILYFLLSGDAPYQGKLGGNDIISKVIAKAPIPLTERQRDLPHDLLAIVQKAMSRELELRYPSARELADDLKKYLNGQLVGAYQYSTSELFARWLQRHRAVVGVAAALLLVVAGSLSYSFYRVNNARKVAEAAQALAETRESEALQQKLEAEALRLAAEEQQQKTIEQSDALALLSARAILEKNPKKALEILAELSPGFKNHLAVRTLIADALSRGTSRVLRNKVSALEVSPERDLFVYSDASHTLHVWRPSCLLRPSAGCQQEQELSGHTRAIQSYLFITQADRPALVSADEGGGLWVWDTASGEGISLVGHSKKILKVSYDEAQQALFTASEDKTLRRWDLRSGEGQLLLESEPGLLDFFLSEDQRRLYFLDPSGDIYATPLDVIAPQKVGAFSEKMKGSLTPDRRWFALGQGNDVLVFDTNTQKTRALKGHKSTALSFIFSKDGKRLASIDADARLILWDLASGRALPLAGTFEKQTGFFFSPDARLFVSNEEGAILFWDAETGALIEQRKDSQFPWPAFSSDGLFFAYPGVENTVRLWNTKTRESRVLLGHQNQVVRVSFSPSGKYLASSGYDGVVRVWDTSSESASSRWVFYGHEDEVLFLSWLDEANLLSGGADQTARLWTLAQQEGSTLEDAATRLPRLAISPARTAIAYARERDVQYCQVTSTLLCQALPGAISRITHLAFSPDGTMLAASSQDSEVRLWSLSTRETSALLGHTAPVSSATFSWDNKKLASVSEDNTVILWDIATKAKEQRLSTEDSTPEIVLFSKDDRFVFAGGKQWWLSMELKDSPKHGKLWLWERSSGKGRSFPLRHKITRDLVLSSSGEELFTSGEDNNLRRWSVPCLTKNLESQDEDPCEGQVLSGHRGRVYQIRSSPDGTLLASAGDDNALRLWDDETGKELRVLRGHTHSVVSVDFSPDGRSLVSSGLEGAVRIWDVSSGESRLLRGHQGMVAQSFFTAEDGVVSVSFDGAVKLWLNPLPKDPEALRAWLKESLSQQDDDD